MPLVTAVDLGKSFGPNDIFSHISLSLPRRARVAIVGPNGIGKTTLLRILVGLEEPTSGTLHRARGLRFGYLPQEAQYASDNTLWHECLSVFADLLAQQAELHRLEALMSQPGQSEEALQVYGPRQLAFERQGGYTYEQRIRQTLSGLGFMQADYERPLSQLSGGQRTRALLANLLLSNPDLILLDEPTNHLDISAVEWLETYLKEWEGAVLIVSHDRYFLDQVAQTIFEMTPALELYHGNYSAYLAQRAERYQRRLEEYQTQVEFVEKEEEYIRRNIAGQNTRQAQGRRKRLERMLEEARITPPSEGRRLHLHLQPVARSGDLVVRTNRLSVGYADEGRPLFKAPDLTLTRGECAAIIGPNGAGKTTFLKTLLDKIPAYAGEVILGANLSIGYFAQAHEGLNPHNNLVGEIQSVAPQMRPGEVRDYLAKFLFTGDDAFKEVSVLSGGERGRLALAKLALSGANLLLLDEPTNHLDLPSQEVLQSVLSDYAGTILLVSHDRYLIDALSTQIWEVDPLVSELRIFDGTYSQFKLAREADLSTAAAVKAAAPGKPASISAYNESDVDARTAHSLSRPAAPSNNNERRRLQQIKSLEGEISTLETRLAGLTRQLENPPPDAAKVTRLGQEYLQMQQLLENRLEEWANLSE